MKSFYGRRKGHSLSSFQEKLLKERLPKMEIGAFDTAKVYHLEIGFGAGEFLNHISVEHPDIQFIGCEPFINGVVSFLQKNVSTNVWLTTESIHDVIGNIPDKALDIAYILFPDPWPKARHHKRRLIQKPFLDKLIKKTKKYIYAATDHPEYAETISELGFVQIDKPDFLVTTKYMAKEKAGKPQYFVLKL
ncbi:MAG: hypothetical protein H6850_00250 [Alphaproteobacteria bacterium]|nr:MAG: hypothetical protein H6850_00250 [Alphaproteobacteria bacterium]